MPTRIRMQNLSLVVEETLYKSIVYADEMLDRTEPLRVFDIWQTGLCFIIVDYQNIIHKC